MVQVNYGARGGWPDELVPRKALKLSFSGPVNSVESLNGTVRRGLREDIFHLDGAGLLIDDPQLRRSTVFHLDLETGVVEKTTAPELFLKLSRHWPERVPGCGSLT